MEVLPVTPDQIVQFVAINIVPMLTDILRTGTYQLALRLKMEGLANILAGSKSGIVFTYIVSLATGTLLAVWLGKVELNAQTLATNSLVILGWVTLVYKTWYEKSDARKVLITEVDKIGPKLSEVDEGETVG